MVDAFVWVKPGGESDGTSDTSAERYDAHCGAEAALQPAPEAGTWFQVSLHSFVLTRVRGLMLYLQAYFQQLVENANPPLSG